MISKRKTLAVAVAVAVVSTIIAGCLPQEVSYEGEKLGVEAPVPPDYAPEAPMVEESARSDAGMQIAATGDTEAAMSMIDVAEAAQSRKVIKTADVDVDVEDLDQAQEQIVDLVDRVGGFISSLTVNEHSTYTTSEIIARVPSASFREVYEAAKALGDVTYDRIGGQDVTEQYANLEIAIENKQALAGRLRELASKSGSVSDLLQVERELSRVRGEIEQLQGQLRRLKDQVAFSTLTLSLTERGEAPVEEAEGWRLGYHFRGALRTLVRSAQGLVTWLIHVVVGGLLWWVLLLIAVLAIRGWWIGRQGRADAASHGDGGSDDEGPPPVPEQRE